MGEAKVVPMMDEIQRLRAALETAESACAGYRETIGAQAATILRLERIEKAAKNPHLVSIVRETAMILGMDNSSDVVRARKSVNAFLEAIGERP